MASNIVHVNWRGPFIVEDVIKNYNKEGEDHGIYQIYGNHPVYGRDSLIYIGIAKDDTFSERFKVHERIWLIEQDYVPVEVYLGEVYRQTGEEEREEDDFQTDTEWKYHIELCEKLLIFALVPSLNIQNKESINEMKLRDLHILNWGHRADLPPEVSVERWTYKYGRK